MDVQKRPIQILSIIPGSSATGNISTCLRKALLLGAFLVLLISFACRQKPTAVQNMDCALMAAQVRMQIDSSLVDSFETRFRGLRNCDRDMYLSAYCALLCFRIEDSITPKTLIPIWLDSITATLAEPGYQPRSAYLLDWLFLTSKMAYIRNEYDNFYRITTRMMELPVMQQEERMTDSLLMIKAGLCQNLGLAKRILGDYQASENYYNQSLALYKRLKEKPNDYYSLSGNIASLHYKIRNYGTAISKFRKLLLGEEPPKFDSSNISQYYCTFSLSYLENGQPDSAIKYVAVADSFTRTKSITDRLKVVNTRADILLRSGKGAAAAGILNSHDSLVNACQKKNINHPDIAKYFFLMGQEARLSGNYASAVQAYDKCIRTLSMDGGNDHTSADSIALAAPFYIATSMLLDALYGRSMAIEKSGDREKALQSYATLARIVAKLRRLVSNDEDKQAINERTNPIFDNALALCWKTYQTEKKEDYILKAFFFSEQYKASRLLEAIAEAQALRQAGLPDSVGLRISQLRQDLTKVEKALLSQPGNQGLIQKKQALQALEEQTINDNPAFNSFKETINPITLTGFLQLLTPGQAAISYFRSDSQIYTIAIMPGRAPVFSSQPADPAFIQSLDMVKEGLQNKVTFSSEGRREAWSRGGQLLFSKLLSPVIDSLKAGKDLKELIIIPDGDLSYIPFEGLPVSAGTAGATDFLIGHFRVVYAYSATVFDRLLHQALSGSQDILGFFPFTSKGRGNLAGLPYTEQEEKMLKRFSHTQILSEDRAKSLGLKAGSSREFNIVHFSTHAGANEKQLPEIQFTDTSLNYNEIANLRLRSSLVVLSACETAGGAFRRGEGVLGLARSFVMAGANSIVATLWKVNDKANAEIITGFYNYLENGLSKGAALRQAKLDYLKAHSAEMSKQAPYYWAAPILIGNDNTVKLEKRRNPLALNLLVGGFMLLLGAIAMKRRKKRKEKKRHKETDATA